MKRYETILNPRHRPAAIGAAFASIVVLFALDMKFPRSSIPILYTFPLLASLWVRDRRFLWALAALLAVCTFIPLAFGQFPNLDWYSVHIYRPLSRALMAFATLATALVIHILIRVWTVAELRRDEAIEQLRRLEENHEELATREEEISRQNEELQSQTEELERQSEELRVANEELVRREKMLESLLQLSRSLTAELSSGDMMGRICEALGQLVDGPGLATAILEKEGDDLVVLCHHGFGPEGVVNARVPYNKSFAALVIERGQTGFIEDLSLRPDIQTPGAAGKFVSILAAPLKVGRHTIGSLQIYAARRRSWTHEQIALIESLAAQTSISLETASLLEDVQQQRRRLQSVLQTVPIGIGICAADGQQIELNPAGAMILGLPNGAALARSDVNRFVMFRDGERVATEEAPIFRAISEGVETHGTEFDILLPGGKRVAILVGASPFHSPDGNIDGAVAAFVDISRLKDLQRELDARRREAEEVSVRKTRFLAAVSHDIRTPANAIGLFGELLQRASVNPALSAEIPELAKDLHRSAMSLVYLVSDVLDLTRMDSGRVDLLESEFDLGSVLTEECRQLQPLAKQKGLQFTSDPPNPPIWIRADRIKLARVLGNLIGNAIKFTAKGSVDVRAARNDAGGIEISVTDTGSGIAPQHIDVIFDEFFQLRNPDRDSSQGSGLGLSISKRLIEAMGGTIAVRSAVDQGSTFTVTLPATAVVPSARAQKTIPQSSDAR